MKERSFEEILKMVTNACKRTFYTGDKDAKEVVIKCATQIYLAQYAKEDKR